MVGSARLGHFYRRRRNAVLRQIKKPLARYIYGLRDGWQVKAGLKFSLFLLMIKPSSIAASAHLHFLYVLNRHKELRNFAWQVATGDSRYRRNQMTLHFLLKSAWILKDKALLALVVDSLRMTKMSHNNVAFVAQRMSAHPLFGFAVQNLAAKTELDLTEKVNSDLVNPQEIKNDLEILELVERFEVNDRLLSVLQRMNDNAYAKRFLGKRAVSYQDWENGWILLAEAVQLDPSDQVSFTDLGEIAYYFDDAEAKIQSILSWREKSLGNGLGYDTIAGAANLLKSDFVEYLRLRDDQVSNKAAHQVYRHATSSSMGRRAKPFQKCNGTGFVIGRDGVSDELRWSYYYGSAASTFKQLSISCDPRLHTLFSRSLPTVDFYPVARNWGRLQVNDCEQSRSNVPNMELASRLDDRAYTASKNADEVMFIEDVPIRDWLARGLNGPPTEGEPKGSTLIPDPLRTDYWNDQLNLAAKDRLAIGLIWRSGLIDLRRQQHYLRLSDFMSLMDLPIDFYSIQHQVDPSEREEAQAMGIKFIDEIDFYNDFDEIAALTANLDLVIGISTLPYEMAAAVGTECWLCAISPLGRWMRLGGQDLRPGGMPDRLTRNGKVFCPDLEDGYLADRSRRVGSIMDQISHALRERLDR